MPNEEHCSLKTLLSLPVGFQWVKASPPLEDRKKNVTPPMLNWIALHWLNSPISIAQWQQQWVASPESILSKSCYVCLSFFLSVLQLSRQPFIWLTSHLAGVLLRTHRSAVLSFLDERFLRKEKHRPAKPESLRSSRSAILDVCTSLNDRWKNIFQPEAKQLARSKQACVERALH